MKGNAYIDLFGKLNFKLKKFIRQSLKRTVMSIMIKMKYLRINLKLFQCVNHQCEINIFSQSVGFAHFEGLF